MILTQCLVPWFMLDNNHWDTQHIQGGADLFSDGRKYHLLSSNETSLSYGISFRIPVICFDTVIQNRIER